jgi:hypothetical protein
MSAFSTMYDRYCLHGWFFFGGGRPSRRYQKFWKGLKADPSPGAPHHPLDVRYFSAMDEPQLS